MCPRISTNIQLTFTYKKETCEPSNHSFFCVATSDLVEILEVWIFNKNFHQLLDKFDKCINLLTLWRSNSSWYLLISCSSSSILLMGTSTMFVSAVIFTRSVSVGDWSVQLVQLGFVSSSRSWAECYDSKFLQTIMLQLQCDHCLAASCRLLTTNYLSRAQVLTVELWSNE